MSASAAGLGFVASMRCRTTSASRSAWSAVPRMTCWSATFGSISPGVSTSTIWVSSKVRIPVIRSRVDWGLGLVMASFWPTSRFNSVDFPTLGRPTTATNPDFTWRWEVGGGRWEEPDRDSMCAGNQLRIANEDERPQEQFLSDVGFSHISPLTSPDRSRQKKELPPKQRSQGQFKEVPATAYSPALSRAEYHRRCRA